MILGINILMMDMMRIKKNQNLNKKKYQNLNQGYLLANNCQTKSIMTQESGQEKVSLLLKKD